MNSPDENPNITKEQLTKKLKASIEILTDDVKNTLLNLQRASDPNELDAETSKSSPKKSCRKIVHYLKIMKYLEEDLKLIEIKCKGFLKDIGTLEVESVGVRELMNLYASDDEDSSIMSTIFTDQLSLSFKDVSISTSAETSHQPKDSQLEAETSIKLRKFSCDSQNFFTSTPSVSSSKSKRASSLKDEVPSKIPKLSHKIIDFTKKQEQQIGEIKKEALSDLNSADIKDKIIVPNMYRGNNSSEHLTFTQFVLKTFYDQGDQNKFNPFKTICVECTEQDKFTYIATLSFTVLNYIESVAVDSGKIIMVVSQLQLDSWFSKFLMWRTDFINQNKINLRILSKECTIDFEEWNQMDGLFIVTSDIFGQIYQLDGSIDVMKQNFYDCVFKSKNDLFIFDFICSENNTLDVKIIKKVLGFKIIFESAHKLMVDDDQCYFFAGNM